ncbi:hypothetical protein RND81_07G104500 [Saponaria officinalis]|uniref:Expansin-like EG45 domain-containing protein n=2 Tax=Saponaria officinalis TaxID=3572 RepID=A0AAW1JTR1_SAPOF
MIKIFITRQYDIDHIIVIRKIILNSLSWQRYSKFNYLIIFIFSFFFHNCYADIGTAQQYDSPYIPTECYSDDTTNFPADDMFAAAGDGIWNNGAACGRQYMVQCISAPESLSCANVDTIIQVKIVDYANTAVSSPVTTSGTTMFLSDIAFGALVDNSSSSGASSSPIINIVFIQVD